MPETFSLTTIRFKGQSPRFTVGMKPVNRFSRENYPTDT